MKTTKEIAAGGMCIIMMHLMGPDDHFERWRRPKRRGHFSHSKVGNGSIRRRR